ncbi:hypothetical protein SAMN05216516_11037 [Izhakiella capsodis]|uniref:Uncharacterized protein n=1 Tax=Izhakiella capsodis TaxID=1367852 RepID=A0A1I4ZXK0_9GAMM|nr:hypothetical protein SAMN05216516_11037 [Izhakiella capsodis]
MVSTAFFEERAAPDAVLNVETAPRNGDEDMRVLIELPTVRMQGTENTDFHTLPAGPLQHGAGGAA